MRRLSQKLLSHLGLGTKAPDRISKRKSTRRLQVEQLEDRTVMTAATASGTISGIAFIDKFAPVGVRTSNEPLLPGVAVLLKSLTLEGAGNTPVRVTTVTTSGGAFSFKNVLPGTYQVIATAPTGFVGTVTLTSPTITIDSAHLTKTQNLAFHGAAGTTSFSLRQVLTNTTTAASSPFNPQAGAGSALATYRPNNTPTVKTALGTTTLPENTLNKTIDLAGFYTDLDFTNSQVVFHITVNGVAKSVRMNLFDKDSPQTVANFFDYIKSGAFNDSIFHRLTKTATDGIGVLQGGALTVSASGTGSALHVIPVGPTVPNEFLATHSNTTGTIAMAQSGGDINSATDQFFFNTANNAASLDSQKFTVFGSVADAASLAVLQSLATATTVNVTSADITHDFPTALMNELPLSNYTNKLTGNTTASSTTVSNLSTTTGYAIGQSITGTGIPAGTTITAINAAAKTLTLSAAATADGTAVTLSLPGFPGNAPVSKYMTIDNVQTVKRDEFLTYSITHNDNDALVTPTITNEFIKLNAVAGQTGTAHIVVRATDRFGAFVEQTMTVTINAAPTVNSVAITPDNPAHVVVLTANPTGTPVSGTETFAYQWMQNGTPISGATGQTLNVTTQITTLKVGDKITVKVTPTDSSGTGAAFFSDPVTIATTTPDITLQA